MIVAGRAIAPLAVVIAMVAVVLVAASGGSSDLRLRAPFDSATNVVAGLPVRAAGRDIGVIEDVESVDGHAVLTLKITDGEVLPLHRGTTAVQRYGTTIGYATRYVELTPGPVNRPQLRDGALLSPARTDSPVEFDDVLKIMDREGRGQLKAYLTEGAGALRGNGRPLGAGLGAADGGLSSLADLMAELGRQRDALATLVAAGSRTTRAVARREGDLKRLVSGLATTYAELTARTRDTTATLDRLPRSLSVTRTTLRRTDASLARLNALTAAIAPGARRLRGFAVDAASGLSTLRTVAPLATSTLRHGAKAAPPITSLLRTGTPFATRLADVLGRSAPKMACLRPYGPELVGFLATWAGFAKGYDAQDHHSRTILQATPAFNGSPMTSAQLVRTIPGIEYAMPRPPGFNVGQPWFIPECGVTKDALDPTKDPEGR